MIEDELVKIVGAENLIQDQAALNEYSTDMSVIRPVKPGCVVRPGNAGEVTTIDTMTVIGKIKFRPDGTVIDPCPAIVQWLQGEQKLVWPANVRKVPFVYPIPPWNERQTVLPDLSGI